ncbi:MAG: InlB B-repeat-containing protein, partial [Butyrivibrio sp.]|nr:InlB B-repeat-containing protein [Butyrivibrio sp.]
MMNVGLLSDGGIIRGKTVKEECYAYVANGSYHVQMGSGAKQNIESMQMWAGLDNAILSPQTVVYIAKSGSNYTLEAQGTSVSQMTSYEIKVGQVSNTTDTYTLTTTVSGIEASLWVDKSKTGVYSFDGVYDIKTPSHYKATTTSQGAEAYRQWKLVPISSSSDNYVAVNASLKAKVEVDDKEVYKYYAPYYASYPFKLVSSGMKVYYVNSITDTKYTLEEITDEVIPAATPVIIECSSNNPADCKIEPLRGNYGSVSGNKLKGVYFCNLSMSPKEYSDARTEFKAASMRVWAVKDDKLVLTNSTDRTIEVALSGFSGYWLRANESYLADVPSTASADLLPAGAASTISFDSNGGTAVDPISGIPGDPVTAPENPTKTGYSFTGWNPALPSVFPEADMSVTAQWQINQYTITFNTNGGTEIPAITQDYGTAITKPSDPTRNGYTFAGWDVTIPDLMPAENKTINALWGVNSYTITFDTDGGSSVAAISQDYGTTITSPANPTKTGYTFAGWSQEIPTTMPAGNVTIKALWTVNQYTITFNTNGGTEIPAITQDYGTVITKPA